MSDRGQTVEALVLVEVHGENLATGAYMMPLSPFKLKTRCSRDWPIDPERHWPVCARRH